MLDGKKKWFLLNSGGGAQASTPPSFLWANGWSETRVDAGLVKVGADSYDFQISDDAGFSNIVDETLASVSELTTFTGLTPDTDYYVRCRADFSGVKSNWLSTSCYTLHTPKYAYDFSGLARDATVGATNEYGKTGNPGVTNQVSEIYSYRGTANTLLPVTFQNNIIETQLASDNKSPVSGLFKSGYLYSPSEDIVLAGDYTILVETSKNNMGAIYQDILQNSANSSMKIRLGINAVQTIFGVGQQSNAPWPSTPTVNSSQRFIIKRIGTSIYAGIMNDDDSISFGAAIVNTFNNNTITIDRLFSNGSAYYFSIMNFYYEELTDIQIQKEFKRTQLPPHTFKNNDKSLMPTGVTWEALSTGNYFIDSTTGIYATADYPWVALYTLGNQSTLRLSKNDTLHTDFLKTFNHLTGEVGNSIEMGAIPGQIYDNHNIGSIFPADNTWFHAEMQNNYGNKIVIKRFGDNFNMAEHTVMPNGNNIPFFFGALMQYLSALPSSDGFILMAQEFSVSGYARYITALVARDNFNFYDKIRIIEVPSSTYWFYYLPIYQEGGTVAILANYYANTNPDRYINSFLILSDDKFQTVRNLGNTFSKNIVGGNLPLSAAEGLTNFLVGTDGTSKTYSRYVTSMFHDPDTSKYYGVETNGDGNGFNFLIDDGAGGWTITVIDLLGHNIVIGGTDGDSVLHGDNIPTMVRTGASSYDFYCQEVVSGVYPNAIWKVVKLSTTDSWATTAGIVDITDDDTNNHSRIAVSHNLHYTGTGTAYNGKKLLACSRNFTGPDHSDTKFVDIS